MALIVEDGTGLVNAESYESVANALTYFTNRAKDDAWSAIENQEAALRLATDYLEEVYRLRWASFRVSATQALSWPRAWVRLRDAPYGYGSYAAYVPFNVIPVEVKHACCELALQSASGLLLPATLGRTASKEKVDVIEVDYERGAPEVVRYPMIDKMLSVYLSSSAAMAPLVRT